MCIDFQNKTHKQKVISECRSVIRTQRTTSCYAVDVCDNIYKYYGRHAKPDNA